jgi:hypothetical protein
MRWVEVRSYIGPDRRRGSKFWLFERRKADLSTGLPAIQVLLRQLHLRVLDVATAREAIDQFHLRLSVASNALQQAGQDEAASHLSHIADKLEQCQQKGDLSSQDIQEVQEQSAAALCALR